MIGGKLLIRVRDSLFHYQSYSAACFWICAVNLGAFQWITPSHSVLMLCICSCPALLPSLLFLQHWAGIHGEQSHNIHQYRVTVITPPEPSDILVVSSCKPHETTANEWATNKCTWQLCTQHNRESSNPSKKFHNPSSESSQFQPTVN